ncbi:MAG TPA: hypothetical protein DCP51_03555 [Clostridiales bacterium]|nr:hypothetical protein [Clostridiales bacterium]
MKTLIGEQIKECENFSLRYLLYEENDCEQFERNFFSLLVELNGNEQNDFATARDFTADRTIAENMLDSLCSGTVTPVGLPYIIEDYLAEI